MFKNLLGFLLFVVFCVACSDPPPPPPQPLPPDTQSPELSLSGLSNRILTTPSTVLEGTLALDVTSFVYRLNGGEPKDLLPSVTQGAFKVTVEGLVPGSNTIVLEAGDAAGNKTVSEPLTINVVDATGLWGSHTAEYRVCVYTIPNVFVVSLTPSPEGFTGLLTTGVGANYKVSTISGHFDESGLLESSVRFPPEFEGDPEILGTVRLQLRDTDVAAHLVYNDGQRCSPNDETPVDVHVEGNLLKGVDVPPLPPDDRLEPNNDETSATRVSLPYRNANLTLVRKNSDWFKLEVTTPSVITVMLETAQINAGATVRLRNLSGTVGEPFFPVHRELPKPPDQMSWGVEAGEYFLEVEGFPYFLEAAMPYKLTVRAVATPDARFEPNNTPRTAFDIALPFSEELYLQEDDRDWFRFTLTEDSDISFSAIVIPGMRLYSDDIVRDSKTKPLREDDDFFLPIRLVAGTYYLQIREIGGARPYTLGFSVTLPFESVSPPRVIVQ